MIRTLIFDKVDGSLRTVMAMEVGYSEDLKNLRGPAIESLFGNDGREGLWICTYDNAIVNFYDLDKETCNQLTKKAFTDGKLDLSKYEDCEWIYPEE